MRHSLLNKEFEKGNYYTYGMPEMDRFLQLRKGYNHSKHYDDSENFATIIFYKLFMPCCGTFANYADKHHKEYLSDIYSTSQEGFVLIELMNNYDKWTEKARELYKRNDIVENPDTSNTNQDTESSSEEEIQNKEKNDIREEGKFTAQGTLYTNSRYCVSMDGWSEAGIRKYNSLCKLAEDDRSGEHCRVFEILFKKKESESKVLKEQAIFKQEDFVQPYNNLISNSDDESSDSSDDDDDNDDIEPVFDHDDLFNEGGRDQEIRVTRKCAV